MTKSKIFLSLSVSFLAGIFAASFLRMDHSLILIIVVSGLAVFVINYKNKKAIVASAAILFFALGLWRTGVSVDSAKNNLTNSQVGPAELTATVTREPETDEKYQKVIIRDSKGRNILINADIYPAYSYGDEFSVKCVLQEPKNFEDSNFDYQMYLAKDGIYRICNQPQISLVARDRGGKIFSAILGIKNKFEEKLSAIFPDPEGAFLKGLLLGGSKRMTKEMADAFSRTGTSHTLAVSGYNVTIVAVFLMWLGIGLGLWRQQVFAFALGGIVLFVLATGAPSSAVRAGIMGSLVIWAMKEGRLANSTNAIMLAAAVMLMINPLLLRYDAGFQLSFLATLGIVYLSPLLENLFWKGRPPKLIKETVILSLAATIFVLPIILSSFEKLSLVSPAANFLILPAIPVIMGTGFAAGIAGFIYLPLGKLIGFLPYFLLKLELLIVVWLANFSWSSLEIKNFGWPHVTIYYLILGAVLFFSRRKKMQILLFSSEQ